MRIIKLTDESKNNILENLLKRSPNSYGKYEAAVGEILANVKAGKDKAFFEYTKNFDKADIKGGANVSVGGNVLIDTADGAIQNFSEFNSLNSSASAKYNIDLDLSKALKLANKNVIISNETNIKIKKDDKTISNQLKEHITSLLGLKELQSKLDYKKQTYLAIASLAS